MCQQRPGMAKDDRGSDNGAEVDSGCVLFAEMCLPSLRETLPFSQPLMYVLLAIVAGGRSWLWFCNPGLRHLYYDSIMRGRSTKM